MATTLWSLLGGVPTRPSQNDPDRAAAWETYRRSVGETIRALRVARGMTQEALALRSGVTRNVLIDVERGRRGLLFERLFDIADALDVRVSRLLESEAAAAPNDEGGPAPSSGVDGQPS